MKLDYGATHRNREPIFDALSALLGSRADVLEVAAGSGQHAAWFTEQMPGWRWFPSDPGADERASIDAWCADRPQVQAAIALDVLGEWPVLAVDAVFCSNMVHIAPWACTPALMAGSVGVLRPGGRLVLYGPFKVDGAHTAASNEAFDCSLRERDPNWGVRDLEAVVHEAERVGMHFEERRPMPANNQVLVFRQAR